MDQRSGKRQRTVLVGRIVFNNRFSLIECRVRDLSDTGARIMFDHPVSIPGEFELEVPAKELSVQVQVMWTNGREHGVRFADSAQVNVRSDAITLSETLLQEGNRSMHPPAGNVNLKEILDDARHRIARITGTSADSIRLKLEVEGAGGKKC